MPKNPALSKVSSEVTELIDMASLAVKQNDIIQAMYHIIKALSLDKKSSKLWEIKAILLTHIGDYQQADKCLDEAIKRSTNSSEDNFYWIYKFELYRMYRQLGDDMQFSDQILKREPKDSLTAFAYGAIFANQGNFVEAERYLILALGLEIPVELEPWVFKPSELNSTSKAETLHLMGFISLIKQDKTKAEYYFEEAIKKNPKLSHKIARQKVHFLELYGKDLSALLEGSMALANNLSFRETNNPALDKDETRLIELIGNYVQVISTDPQSILKGKSLYDLTTNLATLIQDYDEKFKESKAILHQLRKRIWKQLTKEEKVQVKFEAEKAKAELDKQQLKESADHTTRPSFRPR